MLSNLLTTVMLVTLFACNKEYQKSDNQNISTVEKLNSGKYESVISDLESNQKVLDTDKRYYLASAYSQAGSVDVYSLYPVMEIQLFHKNALNWSDLSKEKNPYLKFVKNQEGIDQEKKLEKLQKTWTKYEERLKNRMGMRGKISYEEVSGYGMDFSKESYDKVDSELERKYKEVLALDDEKVEEKIDNVKTDSLSDETTAKKKIAILENFTFEYTSSPTNESSLANILVKYYIDLITLDDIKENFLHPEKKQNQFSNVKWEMVYMNILWNTYEAIPMMKKLPSLDSKQQESLSKALDLYLGLLDNPKYKEVAIKNIIVLSSVSLLSIYKDSFDLESVTSIQDLLCWFEPEVLLNNYSLVRKRLFFLQESYEKLGYKLENYENYKEKIEVLKFSIPEELTETQRDRYIESIDDFKINSCIKS